MKISKKFLRMSEIYKLFCPNHLIVDFSEKSLIQQYQSESLGGQHKFAYSTRINAETYNGYAVGKHFMDLTVKMWKEDINLSDKYETLTGDQQISKTLLLLHEIVFEKINHEWKWPSWFLGLVFNIPFEKIDDIRLVSTQLIILD